jgi:hypothetical protein
VVVPARPAELQPLPLSQAQRDLFYNDGTLLGYVFHLFARSLEDLKYDIKEHPYFTDYVSGVLWINDDENNQIGVLPYGGDELAMLKKRFPPRPLAGIGPAFCWQRPQQVAQIGGHRSRRH